MSISTHDSRLTLVVLGLVVFSLCTAPIVGAVGAATGTTAAEPTLTVDDASVDVGSTATVSIRLSEVPSGLAGYDLRVSVADGSVATITGVSVDETYSMTNTSVSADGTSAYASGVDLDDTITPGASDVPVVTVTVKGVADGTTALRVETVNVDNDDGNDVNPTLTSGTITVGDGTADSPSSGDQTTSTGDQTTTSDGDTASTAGGSTGGSSGGSLSSVSTTTTAGGETQAGSTLSLSATATEEGAVATVSDVQNVSTVTVDVPSVNVTPSALTDGSVVVETLSLDVSTDSEFSVTVGPTDGGSGPAESLGSTSGTEPVGYFTMDAKNLSASALDGARVVFEVNRSALPANTAPEDVTLYRYHDGSWRALETKTLGNGTYAAQTPGFSVFAVGATDQQAAQTTSSTTQTTQTSRTTETRTTQAGATTDSAETSSETTPGFGLVSALVALVAAAALVHRRG